MPHRPHGCRKARPDAAVRVRRCLSRVALPALLAATSAVGGASASSVTPLRPAGLVDAPVTAYTWRADPSASWYEVHVRDERGTLHERWYTAAQSGCAFAGGGDIDWPPRPPAFSCTVAPALRPYGESVWWVRPWSVSDPGTWSEPAFFTTVAQAPPAMVPLAPVGSGALPEYRWEAAGQAAWYRLWIEDDGANVHDRWYRARNLGCAGGRPICALAAPTRVSGSGTWWVQGWNQRGVGPWNAGTRFSR